MSRYVQLSGEQVDAIRRRIAALEAELTAAENEWLRKVKRAAEAREAKHDDPDGGVVGWWNRVDPYPRLVGNVDKATDLLRLRAIVGEFNATRPDG